ncbi:hypothetical protein CTZ27_12115 [Streptomyces griseocarneus]|nr:hypothetical protein CTZ27_12115 [Streptomyces griseocarneus]
MTGSGGDHVGGDYVGGDKFNVYGHDNVGKVQNQYQQQQDPRDALVAAVTALRGRVPDEDRRILDDALRVVRAGRGAEPGALRRALRSIAGVAAVVGEIGAPVTAAVHQVAALFSS